jgi:hypothetical protein
MVVSFDTKWCKFCVKLIIENWLIIGGCPKAYLYIVKIALKSRERSQHIYLSFQPFLQIASYGKGFVKASQDTWELFEKEKMERLVDADITSSICFLTGVCSGSICVIVVAAWTAKVHLSFTATISLLAFFIGYLMVGSLHWPILLYLIRPLYIQIMWSTWPLFNCLLA